MIYGDFTISTGGAVSPFGVLLNFLPIFNWVCEIEVFFDTVFVSQFYKYSSIFSILVSGLVLDFESLNLGEILINDFLEQPTVPLARRRLYRFLEYAHATLLR